MGQQKGFSLIELLIVVAIILIIAAIAIPSLLRAHIAANEASAASSVRVLDTAQFAYQNSYPGVGYAGTLPALGPPAATGCSGLLPTSTSGCLIDWALANATGAATGKSGYYFADTPFVSGGVNASYVVGGAPSSLNRSGVRGFCSTDEGVVRFTASAAAPVISVAGCSAYVSLQ
jgi:type IV pilus assembly protein PilA